MLLSNITASPKVCADLLSLKIPVVPMNDTTTVGAPFYPVQSRCGSCGAPVPYPSEPPQDVLALPLLIDAFVAAAATKATDSDPSDPSRKSDLHFLASVFANISTVRALIFRIAFAADILSQVPAGRTFFLTPLQVQFAVSGVPPGPEFPLSKLVAFTEHSDVIRRGGVASLIKCAT
jgi:hypothetical protein